MGEAKVEDGEEEPTEGEGEGGEGKEDNERLLGSSTNSLFVKKEAAVSSFSSSFSPLL